MKTTNKFEDNIKTILKFAQVTIILIKVPKQRNWDALSGRKKKEHKAIND